MTLDPATPVLVGVGVAMERDDDPTRCVEASELMLRAARRAVVDSDSPGLVNRIGAVAAMGSMSGYSDPAQLVIEGLGLDDSVRRLRADPGVLQQKVFNWAAELVANGMDAALVVAGEAKYRDLRSAITGVDVGVTAQPKGAAADETWSVGREVLAQSEFDARMYEAVQHYAMMEFAMARHLDQPLANHLDGVASLISRQSAASLDNADAWDPGFVAPERIRQVSPGNRMVSWPYAKLHNSQWNVNQGAALLFCRADVATAMGVPRDRWIFLRGAAVSNHVQPLTNRPQLHRAPWVQATAQAATRLAGLGLEDMDAMELYTCFPVAVQVQALEMGIDLDEHLHTITGGMTFAGGPFNSWVLHATVAMAQRLRGTEDRHGLVTSISGMVTKHATAIWSSEPGAVGDGTDGGLRIDDVTAGMADLPWMPEVTGHTGAADLVAATVVHNREGPTRAVAMGEHQGARLIAVSEDPAVMAAIMNHPDDLESITVTTDGFVL